MDRYPALVIVVVLLVLSGVVPGTVTNGPLPSTDATTDRTSVSSFMQISAVTTERTVQREMWEIAFEKASNETEKKRLIAERSTQLSKELSAIKRQQSQFDGATPPSAYSDAYTTHVVELRRSVGNISQTANESNVSSSRLSSLRQEACSVPLFDSSEELDAKNITGIDCPEPEADDPTTSPNNSTTETDENTTVDDPDNTTATPDNDTATPTPGDDTPTATPNETPNETPDTPTTDTPTSTPSTPNGTDSETEQSTTTDTPTDESAPTASDLSAIETTATPVQDRLVFEVPGLFPFQ